MLSIVVVNVLEAMGLINLTKAIDTNKSKSIDKRLTKSKKYIKDLIY
jgi:hypothetical protein